MRPGNCPTLTVTRVNPEIWSKLSSVTRSRDIKIQRVTNVITQSMVAITSVAENLVTATRSDEALSKAKMATALTALVDGLALMANANQDLNQRRREDQRGDLNAEFRRLCSAAPEDNSQLLYGPDITARFKTISDTNRITAKLAPVTATGSGARHDTMRAHGASSTRFRPYGSQRRPSWSSSLRGGFFRARKSPQLPRQTRLCQRVSTQVSARQSQRDELIRSRTNNTTTSKVTHCHSDSRNIVKQSDVTRDSSFIAGATRDHLSQWTKLTSDKFILRSVAGSTIEFDHLPTVSFTTTTNFLCIRSWDSG